MTSFFLCLRLFKGRSIDRAKPVKVYRNLNRGGYSIQQAGLVVAHTEKVVLRSASFSVNERGRQAVIKAKRKAVHAYAVGLLTDSPPASGESWQRGRYNPYVSPRILDINGEPIATFNQVMLNDDGMFVRSG